MKVISAGYAACAMQLDGGLMLAKSVNISWVISPLGRQYHEPGNHCAKEGAAESSHVLSVTPRCRTGSGVLNSLSSNVRIRLMRSPRIVNGSHPSASTPQYQTLYKNTE